MPTIVQNLGSQLIRLGQRIAGRPMSVNTKIFPISQAEIYDNIDQEKAITKGFNTSEKVYVVVKKDAEKFGSIPRYVYTNSERETKARHPLIETKAFQRAEASGSIAKLIKLLDRPNTYMSQDLFFAHVRAYYKICGEAFIWLNRGDIQGYRLPDGSFDDAAINRLPVLEMYVLPSHMVGIIPDEENVWGVLGYTLSTTGNVVMRKDDVIHWRDLNLTWNEASRDHLRGMTPLTPGSALLAESNSITRASMRQAQNEGAKAIVFDKSMKAMTPKQESDIKRVIDAKVNNNETAGSVAAVQGDWGVVDLAMSSRDMEMIEKKKMSWRDIALLFGVPPNLVESEQTYDNQNASMLQWVYSLIPGLKQLDGELNRVLLPAFGIRDTAFIASDVSDLPEVRKQMIEEAKLMQDIWSIPPNEVLEHLGFDRNPDPKFDEPWVTSGRTPLSESSLDAQADNAMLTGGY